MEARARVVAGMRYKARKTGWPNFTKREIVNNTKASSPQVGTKEQTAHYPLPTSLSIVLGFCIQEKRLLK